MSERPADRDRTETASAQRRRHAREAGDVVRSNEVGSVAVLVAAVLALLGFGPGMLRSAFSISRAYLGGFEAVEIGPGTVTPLAHQLAASLATVLLPLGAVVVLAGVGAGVAQTGIRMTGHPLVPTLRRLAPARGLRRILSRRGGFELGKAIVKLSLVGGAVAWAVRGALEELLPLTGSGLGALVRVLPETMLQVAAAGTLALGTVALLDLAWQRRDRERRLAMTREQVREERRQSEGDPLVKAKLRARRQEITGRRTLREVRGADVVVADRTRIAIALRYEPGRMPAPRVVARGAGRPARRLRDIAAEARVPVVDRPDLARALHLRCEAGTEIPRALYEPVAELLADVYRAQVRTAEPAR